MVVAVVVLAVVYVLTAVVGVALWLGLRQHGRLIAGFRKDFEYAIMSVHECIARGDTRSAESFRAVSDRMSEKLTDVTNHIVRVNHTAAIAQDRLMYYTKHSAILGAIGAKYDKAIAKIRAKAEAEQAAAQAVTSEAPRSAAAAKMAAAWADVDRDLADAGAPEGTAQAEGIAGSIGIPCG